MARDHQIMDLETKVKQLEANLCRAIEQIRRCDLCRLSFVTDSCQLHQDTAITTSSDLPPHEPHQDDAIRNSSDLPPHQDDAIRNSSDLPPHQDDAIRNSSDLPPHQDDAIRNSSDLPPHEPHQVTIRNSSDLPPHEPHQGDSNDLPEPCRGDANNSNDALGIQFISYSPKAAKRAKPSNQKSSQRWKIHADEFKKKSTVPIITKHDDGYWRRRIRSILSGVSVSNGITSSSSTTEGSLRNFARITKATKDVCDYTRQVHAFQQLILVSACSVLIDSGAPTSEVDSIMRLCVSSNSTSAYLHRLRKGSQWANEQISSMAHATLGLPATEYIFHCAMSINKYGNLAQSPRESKNYLKAAPENLPSLPSLPEEYIPLFVPSFVQVVLKGRYTLHKVCKKLNVPDSYVNETTISLCHQYTAIRDAAPSLLPSPESRKRTMDEQPASGRKTKHRRGINEPSTSSTPTECDSGTEDMALVSPSEREGSAENIRTSPDDLQTNRHSSEKTVFGESQISLTKSVLTWMVEDGIGSLLEAAGRIQEEPNRASQNQAGIGSTSPEHPTDRFSGHNISHLSLEVDDDGRSQEPCLGPEINVEKWDRILDSERNSGNWVHRVPLSDPEIIVEDRSAFNDLHDWNNALTIDLDDALNVGLNDWNNALTINSGNWANAPTNTIDDWANAPTISLYDVDWANAPTIHTVDLGLEDLASAPTIPFYGQHS
ncbi:hypothetical protein V501_02314 [Pseudogymnoascus sp. VKM F-4519 (FW-2642)]|nr:hypothetical protein V501_02314 [Pseudogymnoascus sp. VKM F-4519 (FW-2642)]